MVTVHLQVAKWAKAPTDGVTDASDAINEALEGLDLNRGGDLFVPQGRYRLASSLLMSRQGSVFVGEGKPGTHKLQALGSTRLLPDEGVTAIVAGTGSHATIGFGFENLHVVGQGSGAGIVVRNAERTTVKNVTCSDFTSGAGFQIDGQSGNAQYAHFDNYSGGDCLYGLHLTGLAPNGLRLFGGYFQGAGVTPRPGSIGIYVEKGDTARLFAPVIQGYETGIHIASSAAGHEIHGLRSEYNNIGIRFSNTTNPLVLGGTFTKSFLTAPAIGIQVDASVTGARLMPGYIAADVATPILDNGVGTKTWGDF